VRICETPLLKLLYIPILFLVYVEPLLLPGYQSRLHCCSGCRTNGPGYCQTRISRATPSSTRGHHTTAACPPSWAALSLPVPLSAMQGVHWVLSPAATSTRQPTAGSQGSVATQLRCGGMFSNHFITNFPRNSPVKKFWKSVNISQRYGQNFVAFFFWATL